MNKKQQIKVWKDIDLNQVRQIIAHCQECGIISCSSRENGFRCEYCGKFILEQRKMETRRGSEE